MVTVVQSVRKDGRAQQCHWQTDLGSMGRALLMALASRLSCLPTAVVVIDSKVLG